MRKASLAAAFALLAMLFAAPSHAATVVAKVDVSQQRMNVYVGGQLRHSWAVSTGRGRYATPGGTFRPYRMHAMWHSRKYNMAPMPHSVFYRGGYAVHGTVEVNRLGRPASRGCVRLHPTNARTFYNLVRQAGMKNTRIEIRR